MQNVSLLFQCVLSVETITSGQVVLTVQKVGTPFDIKKTVDLCDLVKKVKMSCPLQKGTFHLDVSHKIPSFVPPVSINNAKMFNICDYINVILTAGQVLR